MRETLPAKLLLQLIHATPEKLAAVERLLARTPPSDSAQGGGGSRLKPDPDDASEQPDGQGRSCFTFRRTGKFWEVVFGRGRLFRLRNTLAARYLNYLLHDPNKLIGAFDLEVKVQPEKGEARVRDSIQPESDPQARREYRQELRRLKAERADLQAAGDREQVEGLDGQIAALESALRTGGGAADTGERARDNVRKSLAVLTRQLREGGPEEKAFAEHLRTHLSIGHECLYSQPQGRIWG